MKNLIGKTIVKTVLGLVVALALAFVIMSFGFPQYMADMCEDLGAYRAATGYASLRYAYTRDISDLDRCARGSIFSGDGGRIIKYCGKLTEDEDFALLCGDEGEDYRQYIFANLAAAEYGAGQKDEAVATAERALSGVEGFPKNNALAILAIRVAEDGDGATAATLLCLLADIAPADGQADYYQSVKNILQEI